MPNAENRTSRLTGETAQAIREKWYPVATNWFAVAAFCMYIQLRVGRLQEAFSLSPGALHFLNQASEVAWPLAGLIGITTAYYARYKLYGWGFATTNRREDFFFHFPVVAQIVIVIVLLLEGWFLFADPGSSPSA